MTYKVIINPYANRWRAQQQIEQIRATFNAAESDFELVLTTRAGEAAELAARAVTAGYSGVVAVGGDGTVSEIVNGLVSSGAAGQPTIPLGIIPAGTGNDFSDMVGLPRDVDAAIAGIVSGNARQVDVGQVAIDGAEGVFFDNNSALAMEAMVGLESQAVKRLHGTPRYLAALVTALRKLEAWPMQIEWEGGRFEGRSVLLSVCNGPRAGSTFMMAPDAQVDDGVFDVVLAPDFRMGKILRILPRLFNGSYLKKHPEVMSFRTPWLKIRCAGGTPIHADGEMLANSAETITYSILPGKLTLLGNA